MGRSFNFLVAVCSLALVKMVLHPVTMHVTSQNVQPQKKKVAYVISLFGCPPSNPDGSPANSTCSSFINDDDGTFKMAPELAVLAESVRLLS